jgi:diguanylate cyclase (GGDEF)-like protein
MKNIPNPSISQQVVGMVAELFTTATFSDDLTLVPTRGNTAILLETQAQLQHLLFSSPVVIYSRKQTVDYPFSFVSENVSRHFGYDPAVFLASARFWQEQIHPEDIGEVLIALAHAVAQGDHVCEYRFLHPDGSYRWFQDSFKLVETAKTTGDTSESPTLEIIGCWQDITARKQAEVELRRRDQLLQGVAAATHQLLVNTDENAAISQALATLGQAAAVDRVYLYENHVHPVTGAAVMRMRFEWSRNTVEPRISQAYGQCEISPPGQAQPQGGTPLVGLPQAAQAQMAQLSVQSPWYEALAAGSAYTMLANAENTDVASSPERERPAGTRVNQGAVADTHPMAETCSILLIPIQVDQRLWGFMGFDDDLNQRQWTESEKLILATMAHSMSGAIKRYQAEVRLNHYAFYDQLTQLPNRMLCLDRLWQIYRQNQRHPDYRFAVLLVSVDRLQRINDSWGHKIGDQLLVTLARRLEACLRPSDTVARLAGDEFAILLAHLKSSRDAVLTAERIMASLTQPLQLDPDELFPSISIGVDVYQPNYKTPEILLRNASRAMYQAKTSHRNRIAVFNAEMSDTTLAKMQLEAALRRAIERHELIPYYQPIVALTTGQIVGFEALLRWQHPERGLISPLDFIPLAEESGMILAIGELVLQQACLQLAQWQQQLVQQSDVASSRPLTISVNLSAKQLLHPEFLQQIHTALELSGIDGSCLKLELTESVIMQHNETTSRLLNQLKNLRIQLHMDDFGAGYSSLSYLHHLPINAIKIDRAFIHAMLNGEKSLQIVQTILTLAENMGVDVIAEGIEVEAQRGQLQALGCEYGQGYLFSRPLSAVAATALLLG